MRRSAATAAVRRQRLLAVLPVALAVIAAVAYAAISVYRHDHFASQAFDLGVQDQTVWGYSRLQMIPNTLVMIRNLLGDHFHPILMAIAPLYWIWDDVRVLFVVQAMLLAVAGLPIFWWARERLGLLPAFAFEAAYLVFWGILSGVIFDFHHIAFAVPAISFGLYAVLTNRNRLFWAMLALGLLTREDTALTEHFRDRMTERLQQTTEELRRIDDAFAGRGPATLQPSPEKFVAATGWYR